MKRLPTITVPFLLLLFSYAVSSAQKGPGNYQGDFRHHGNEVTFTASHAQVRLDFCTPRMFRVRIAWNGSFAKNEHWMVRRYNWPPVSIQTRSLDQYLEIKTDSLSIRISKYPVRINVYTATGVLLSSESNTATGDDGSFRVGDTVGCKKMMQPGEHFFGFGERMDFLDRRGKKISLNVGRGEAHGHLLGAYNTLEANYCPIPFFMSTRGYGIFFHNTARTTWDLGATRADALGFQADGGALDYYFIGGPGFPGILRQYTRLTGAAPLLPEFALGLQVGTYSGGTWGHEALASPAYVLELVRKFRKAGIPIDILFLDSTWRLFAAGGHGATTFEWRKAFADPKRMFDSLYALHLHEVGLHIRPRLDNGPRFHLLAKAQAAGITYPEHGKPGEFPNYFDTTAVNWWWNHAVMNVASIGAKFLKTDEGSAFGRKANESDKTGPEDAVALSLHNIFPLAYTRAAFTKFMQYNGIRGMNQTREGYAGIQRFPYIFAGDWPSRWQFFGPVIKAGLNIGLSGVGYWTHCMGGFEQQPDPELYIRWCQFGMLSPVAMVFGMDHPGYKEPWSYGPAALRNFKKYDSLRYCLLPYLYSAAYQLYQTGMPLMRALVLCYQNDHNVYHITDQYLLGDNLMVCPVTTKGARSRVVYFPKGTWYDFWSGKKYQGKRYATVLCPLDQIPLFVKGGGIIPMQPEMQYVGQKPIDTLRLEIYPADSSTYTLYSDDGTSLRYQDGDYALTHINCREKDGDLRITIKKPAGRFRVNQLHYILNIHSAGMPSSVTVNGGPLSGHTKESEAGWHYVQSAQILQVRPAGSNREDLHITVNR